MFATLKNKIKEETGKEVAPLPVRMGAQGRLQRSAFGSTSSQFADAFSAQLQQQLDQKDVELAALRLQCSDLAQQLDESSRLAEAQRKDIDRVEQSNQLLEESLKVAQKQKELIYDEQDKIQNIQLQEISKLKGLLNFREQEAVDQQALIKQQQHQVDGLKAEIHRLRERETQHDEIQDEFEKLTHSAQQERNQISTAMALLKEQNRHLSDKVHVLESASSKFDSTLNRDDEQVQRLLAERRMLEQRLEEAHLHLADIKSTWSAQNLALETQVSRLSHQVAAETTEKRKALHSQDDQVERMKQLQFELDKCREEIVQRDAKIRLLTEEVDDLNSTLKDLRLEGEEDVQFLRTKVKQTEDERDSLRSRLDAAELRVAELNDQNDEVASELRQQTEVLRDEVQRLASELESETQSHRSTALKNAEISQEMAKLKQDLNDETAETADLTDALSKLNERLAQREAEYADLQRHTDEMRLSLDELNAGQESVNAIQKEMAEKNKEIKILKQRLADFKKTLQDELKSAQQVPESALIDVDVQTPFLNQHQHTNGTLSGGSRRSSNHLQRPATAGDDRKLSSDGMTQDVNFMYLKHVIMKFLTCRDVEAKHLIKAVATLLQLNQDEERLLHNSVDHKSGWFSIKKPDLNGYIM